MIIANFDINTYKNIRFGKLLLIFLVIYEKTFILVKNILN